MPVTKSPADQVIDFYERRGADWAADRQRTGFPEHKWLNRFARLIAPSSAVLDLGCGAGVPIACYLIDGGFNVTGVDGSLKEYRSLLAENGFETCAHVVEDPDCGNRTVWLAQLKL